MNRGLARTLGLVGIGIFTGCDGGSAGPGNDAGPGIDAGPNIDSGANIDSGSPPDSGREEVDGGQPEPTHLPAEQLPDPDGLQIPLVDVGSYDRATKRGTFDGCSEVVDERTIAAMVDDTEGEVDTEDNWSTEVIDGAIGGSARVGKDPGRLRRADITWRLALGESGWHRVEVHLVPIDNGDPRATYTVKHQWDEDGEKIPLSHEALMGPQWVTLGFFPATVEMGLEVRLESVDHHVVADAIRATRLPRPHFGNAEPSLFASANVYADPAELLIALERMGYGQPGDAARFIECQDDLEAIKRWEETAEDKPTEEDISQFGPCGGAWVRSLTRDPVSGYGPTFEEYLYQKPREDVALQFFSAGTRLSTGFEWRSTQVVVAPRRDGDHVLVAFRGTESWLDIAMDTNVIQVGGEELERLDWVGPEGAVHKGFHISYEEVRNILAEKRAQLGEGRRYWVTGHSLGGALATLHAMDLMDAQAGGATHRLAGLTTFGSPRVGNAGFRDHFHRLALELGVSTLRLQNHDDIVTGVPLSGYHHVGTPVRLSSDGTSYEYMSRVGRFDVLDSSDDHATTEYWDKIMAWDEAVFAAQDTCPIE